MHIAQHYPLSLTKGPMWKTRTCLLILNVVHHYLSIFIIQYNYPIHYPLQISNIIIQYIIHYHYPIHHPCPRCRTDQDDRLRTSFLPSLPPPSWIYRGEQIQNIPMWIDTRYAEVNNTKYTEVNKYKIYPSQKVKQILHPSDNFRSSYF